MTATLWTLENRIKRLQTATLYTPHTLNITPVHIANTLGITLDDWQQNFLASKEQRILVNCSRQTGKSSMAAILGLHTALTKKNATVLLLSPSLRQSSELFRKVLTIYNLLHRPVAIRAESSLRLELVNSSRIISLPGREDTIRGISAVTLAILDEASRIEDDLFIAVSPMLAVSNGRLIMLSTPFGARGRFHEAYKHRDEWQYFEVPATNCPRISPAFLEKEFSTMGEWSYLQEYCCQFMATQSALFRIIDIDRIIHPEVTPWIL